MWDSGVLVDREITERIYHDFALARLEIEVCRLDTPGLG